MEHTLIIVYKEKDKVIVNQLRKLLETKDDTEEGIVGVADSTVTVVPWEEKVWVKNEAAGTVDSKVLLIGKVKGSGSLEPIIDVKFKQHGITYGWAGTQAVISIDEKALSKKEAYEAFLEELRTMSNSSITEYERGKRLKRDSIGLVFVFVPILCEIFTGKMLADAFKDAKMVHQQMLIFAVTHLYLNNLTTFLEE